MVIVFLVSVLDNHVGFYIDEVAEHGAAVYTNPAKRAD